MKGKDSACIGLVGGLAVGASCEYYKRLAAVFTDEPEPMRLVLVHADLNEVVGHMRNPDPAALAEYLGSLIKQLAAASATLAAITSVASHMHFDDTARESPLPLVSILSGVRDEVARRKLSRVALFGSRFALQSKMYGALSGVTEVVSQDEGQISALDAIYMAVARQGFATRQQRDELSRSAHDLLERGKAETIILAGTDLSVVYNEQYRPDFPSLDAVDIHVAAILRLYREQNLP